MDDPVYKLLGLCMKAGRLLSGNEQVRESIKSKKGTLLIIAEDCAEKAKKEYLYLAESASLPVRLFGDKDKLGAAVGKGIRTALLITDHGFGKSIAEKIDDRK